MKKRIVAIVVCGVIAAGLIGCGLKGGEPVVYEIQSETKGSDVVGEYSILEIPQSGATMEYLTDWYNDYVLPSGHTYDIIEYTDGDLGVWANDVTMNKDVKIADDNSWDYGGESVGYELKDGEMVEWWNEKDME
ncbi:MAG: hypothetical protein LUD72_11355 [Bacteroidales bacterium]|nr:hypothetical protein [Bacteroidales bacterium]